jgi:outer membrane protein OmpA-like peptidoglycan-associated protein
LRPLAFFESIGSEDAMVEPGEQTEQTVPVYYDQQGWIFREPGEYELRARLRTDSSDAISTPVVVRVEAPRADIDRAVLQPLLDADARLDDRMGRLLIFGGRIGQPADIGPLEEAAEPNGRTALGAALRLTLASQRLRPPIDPRTGERPLADLGAARALLEDTCADSGIAALREQLLARHEIAPSQDAGTLERSSAMAWDGTGFRRGEPVATYSDPNLRALGPSLHFCFDEAGLRRRVDRALQHLARELRRARPARIVVVGHADYEGSCRRNDELARRRAQAVRRALIHYGVRGASIGIASLGERRPLDFATIREAHALNRRVEILAETESGDYASEPQRVLPEC